MSASNKFLFAYTDASSDGAVGYNDIKHLCIQLHIKVITATGMRHRASMALWGMTISESQIDSFMEHIGQQKQMDQNMYACPPALLAMNTVTPLPGGNQQGESSEDFTVVVLFSIIYIFRFDDNNYQSFVLG